MKCVRLASSAVVLLALAPLSHAALIAYANPGDLYSQNFDNAAITQQANTSTALTWTDDSTVPGWKAYHTGGGSGTGYTTAGPAVGFAVANGLVAPTNVDIAFFRSQTGTSPNFTWSTDAALGAQNFNANTGAGTAGSAGSALIYGFGLVNNTGQTLLNFNLNYTWELWSANGTTTVADTVPVTYALGATGVSDGEGTWNFTTAGWTSPAGAASTNTAGTAAGGTIQTAGWQPGQTLWIRWQDFNWAGNDRGMGIDNVQFTAAVPEPASLAAMTLVGLTALSRRRSAKA